MQNPDDAPSTDSVGRRRQRFRRIARILALLVPILLIGGISVKRTRGKLPPQALDANRQLAQSDISSRIVMQQIDEIFDNIAASIHDRGELTEQDARLLRLWRNYDEQFLISTRDNPSVRYMRATARLRLGLIEQLLGEHETAVGHFQKGAEILEILLSESPGLPSYQGELIVCWMNASESALQTGDRQLAAECVGELQRQLSRPDLADHDNIRGFRQILATLEYRLAALP